MKQLRAITHHMTPSPVFFIATNASYLSPHHSAVAKFLSPNLTSATMRSKLSTFPTCFCRKTTTFATSPTFFESNTSNKSLCVFTFYPSISTMMSPSLMLLFLRTVGCRPALAAGPFPGTSNIRTPYILIYFRVVGGARVMPRYGLMTRP